MMRRPKALLVIFSLMLISGCVGSPSEDASPKAELVGAKLIPYTTAQGKQTQAITVSWKNVGKTPIRAVHADMTAFDAQGNPVGYTPAKDYCVYADYGNNPGILPGATYSDHDGYVLIFMPDELPAQTVSVRITRAEEHSKL